MSLQFICVCLEKRRHADVSYAETLRVYAVCFNKFQMDNSVTLNKDLLAEKKIEYGFEWFAH